MSTSQSSGSGNGNGNDNEFQSCFIAWVTQQEGDLNDLFQSLPSTNSDTANTSNTATDSDLLSLVSTIVRHFQEYSDARRALVQSDPPVFFCPFWCSSFENSFLWLGGCRPSMSIRLMYAQTGSEMESHIREFLSGTSSDVGGSGGMIELTSEQTKKVEELHRQTIMEEDALTSRMMTLQEDVVDKPTLMLAKKMVGMEVEGRDDEEVSRAMDEYGERLAELLGQADDLRIATVRRLVMEILTPRQAVELLAAGKQLHLAMHAWGQNRDRGRRQD